MIIVFSHLTPLTWVRMGLLFGYLGMEGCSIFPIFITSDVELFKIPDATMESQLWVRQNPGGELLFKLSDSTSPGVFIAIFLNSLSGQCRSLRPGKRRGDAPRPVMTRWPHYFVVEFSVLGRGASSRHYHAERGNEVKVRYGAKTRA